MAHFCYGVLPSPRTSYKNNCKDQSTLEWIHKANTFLFSKRSNDQCYIDSDSMLSNVYVSPAILTKCVKVDLLK